ncbi:MAG: PaaI family thioesterase, partial [Candidatus Dormibacteria bacterium]
MKTVGKELLDRIVALDGDKPRFIDIMRIPTVDGWEEGRVWTEWSVPEDFVTPAGTLFGGYFAAVADSLLGVVMFSVLEDGEFIATSQLDIRLLRPARGGDRVRCEATVVNRGSRMAHCEAVFTAIESGKL